MPVLHFWRNPVAPITYFVASCDLTSLCQCTEQCVIRYQFWANSVIMFLNTLIERVLTDGKIIKKTITKESVRLSWSSRSSCAHPIFLLYRPISFETNFIWFCNFNPTHKSIEPQSSSQEEAIKTKKQLQEPPKFPPNNKTSIDPSLYNKNDVRR